MANEQKLLSQNDTLPPHVLKKYSRVFPENDGDAIVISGMAGRFPNSRNVAEYEYNLYNKIDMVDDDERRWRHFNSEIPQRGGKIYDIEKFDATFFGVHFKQAHTMDPQSRILIETAYEAVVDAGINPKVLRGTKTGVFIGSCTSESEKTWFYEKVTYGGFGITGCSRAMMANRISYILGLQGPSFLIDTACSSSMYALDSAFSMLRSGEIDAAIIGGANLTLHPLVTLQFARLGVLAFNGFCRPFDKDATGYTRSEAINCMFLQRKRDAKRVYAHVIYSKTNCDGYKQEGITYPSGKQQGILLSEFYKEINFNLMDLGFLEAHSTGTPVGDPEECNAIDNVICKQRTEPLLVGSVKSNIGHTEPASGICSLVKVCLAFESGKIAPNLNFNEVRPEVEALAEGRLKVVDNITDLKKPYVGVNSFGFGGANAHALLKMFDRSKLNMGLPNDDIPRLVPWSGRTEEAVNIIFNTVGSKPLDSEFIALLHNIHNEDTPGMVFRGYAICAKNGLEPAKIIARDVRHYSGVIRPVVWVFSGMGSQWPSMGSSLMIIPRFRQSIELCHNILKSKGLDLLDILISKKSDMFENILHSFVGIAAIQIALVDVLRELNLEPDFIIGHSVGELGCGYADGGLTAEQMILSAYFRGRVSLEMEKIKGAMAAVGIGFKEIVGMLPESIEVACHNSANSCTISGPAEDVKKFVAYLKERDIFAKEVPCSNIAYHSRYIAHMGPQLQKYLQRLIPKPKTRTKKWLSSSVAKMNWDQPGRNLCSAEYHTNNLLNSVLFEETFSCLPNNSMTIEIAPHGLLQAILRQSMPQGVHIPLTQRGNSKNSIFFLSALGKMFSDGLTFSVEKLYPKVEFPVSRSTSGISSLIRWDHSEDWFVTKYENMITKASGERHFTVDLNNDDDEFVCGHMIDGKILLPATLYLQNVWETLSLMLYGPSYRDFAVEFEDIRFLRATNMKPNSKVKLTVMIHYGTRIFEITESGSLVVTGRIHEAEPLIISKLPEVTKTSDFPVLSRKDFYKELKLRGYHYKDAFRAVVEGRGDGLSGKVEWKLNWVTFMDAMLQIFILGTDSRSLCLPTKIRKLRINGKQHFDMIKNMDPENQMFDVFVDAENGRIVSGGIEIIGLQASTVQRRRPPGIPILEKYQFQPHFPSQELSITDAVTTCLQLALENNPFLKCKFVEVDISEKQTILPLFVQAIENLPVVTGDFLYLSNKNVEDISGVHCENSNLSAQTNCTFVIMGDINNETLLTAYRALIEKGYLILRQQKPVTSNVLDNFELIARLPILENDESLCVLQKRGKSLILDPVVVEISVRDTDFNWVEEVKTALSDKKKVVLYSFNEPLNGSIGLVNCLRKEPNGELISYFFIDDKSAPKFSLNNSFYLKQYELSLAINVYRKERWGSYRHFVLNKNSEVIPRSGHIYANALQLGDLSSLRWFEGPMNPSDCQVKIIYASLNFKDVMHATGRLPVEIVGKNRMVQSYVMGFEYSGIDLATGRRIMSMCVKGGVASFVEQQSRLIWDVPQKWTLQEAATVPVVYVTVYYAFFMHANIRKGKNILIHAGTGGVGLAAIRVALAYNLEVFTTCSTTEKKQFLLKEFPSLKESHIGNSRDSSFEEMIHSETQGKGVDFVLNSLSEEKLLASIRCLGFGGHFLEIGKFDMVNDTKLGMEIFLKEITFHAVLADHLVNAPDKMINELKQLIDADMANGIIQPLPVTIFTACEVEKAFRHLIGGKHIGKVLVQVYENEVEKLTKPVRLVSQVYFNSHLSYIIAGGLGGFGLELADWMAVRGAKRLVLSSSRGITKDYQAYRIALWKTYGCMVHVSTSNICTIEGCRSLLKEAESLGPVGGIFNLAVRLQDAIFENQSADTFKNCFGPKAVATKHLDELSRVSCTKLHHFVVFSSVSCGRGNAGQSNYGMANSVMERIVEDRVRNGLPGKAIQWGAVGEVGLVADMADEKIDIEIGGTLQQRISSCLQELDSLLTSPDAIVSSMVVAEKRARNTGSASIVDTVMNIMGIRDLKSISLSATLSEIGMDSLMAVEIKQVLERDFELSLSAQELRVLNFQKLQEFAEANNSALGTDDKLVIDSGIKTLGMELLLQSLGDETNCHEILLPLKTAETARKKSGPPLIIVPGLEGTAAHAWYKIGENLKNNAIVLQLYELGDLSTVNEIVDACLGDVRKLLNPNEPFYLIGYSFGSLVVLKLALLLEKMGYQGRIMLIDGAPHFLKKLTLAHMGTSSDESNLQNTIFSNVVSKIFPGELVEAVLETFNQHPTFNEKLSKFMEYVAKQGVYSAKYAKTVICGMIKRALMTISNDLENMEQLKSPIMLIRPAEATLPDMEHDYCVSKLTANTVAVKIIEGNHSTMLVNPKLPQLLNDFDPALNYDKNFDTYIRDVKSAKNI